MHKMQLAIGTVAIDQMFGTVAALSAPMKVELDQLVCPVQMGPFKSPYKYPYNASKSAKQYFWRGWRTFPNYFLI